LVALLVATFSVSALADSQVRIVRLSDVQGEVKIDRDAGDGYQKAFLNMPITQGTRLHTGIDGRAEIEFENGSIIHLTPNTIIQFTTLGLQESGTRVSTINLQKGQAYFDFSNNKSDQFTVSFLDQKAAITEPAHFRVNLGDSGASVAVFKGAVNVDGPGGKIDVAKKQTATFDLDNQQQASLSKNIEQDPFDDWDKKQAEYHQRYTDSHTNNGSGYFGSSDLAYYGNYMNVPGYGMMWRPYFAGAGWDPFMDGAWMWSPGFGYGFVSAYPWGWLPYHYGGWSFVPGFGWMWAPGASLVAFQPIAPVVRPPAHYVPPRPPAATARNTVIVGRGPTTSSFLASNPSGSKIVVRGNMAGIGVPRGVSNLAKANQSFVQNGTATVPAATRITTAAPPAAMNGGRTFGPGRVSPSRSNSGGARVSGGAGTRMSTGSSAGHSGSASSHSSSPHR
jgi:hypothetical protein